MTDTNSKITTQLAVDDAVSQTAGLRTDRSDRRLIDNQIRGIEQHLVNGLIRGKHATWFRLDSASAQLTVGQVVCSSPTPSADGIPLVTLATPSALAAAGTALGVVLQVAAPGNLILVAIGGVVPATLTRLGAFAGPARVHASTYYPEHVGALAPTDWPLGATGSNGDLTIAPQIQGQNLGVTVSGTLYTLDAGSASLVAGDRVAMIATGINQLTTTKGVAAAVKAAGGGLGLVLTGYAPGASNVVVAIGGTIPASITGLGGGAAGPVVWDATGRLKRARRSSAPGIAGYCDATGKVTLKEIGYGGVTSPRHVYNITDPAYGGAPDCDVTHGTLFGDLTFTLPPTDNLAAWNAIKAAISASGSPGVVFFPAPEGVGAGYYFSQQIDLDTVAFDLEGDAGYGTGGGSEAPASILVFDPEVACGVNIKTSARGSTLRKLGITQVGSTANVARDQVSLASVNSHCVIPSDASYGYRCRYNGPNKRAGADPSRSWPHDYLPQQRYYAGDQIIVFVIDDTNANLLHAYRYQAVGDGVSDIAISPDVNQVPPWTANANYSAPGGTRIRATAANWYEYEIIASVGANAGAVEPTWAGHLPGDTFAVSGVTYQILNLKVWPRDLNKTIVDNASGGPTPVTWKLVDTSETIADSGLDGAFNWTVLPMQHGVQSVALAHYEHLCIYDFGGDGIHLEASVGGGTVMNGWSAYNVTVNQCAGSGIFCVGDDVNASAAENITVQGCMGWGIDDRSFLGVLWKSVQVAPRVGGFDQTDPTHGTRYGRGPFNQTDLESPSLAIAAYAELGQPPSRAIGGLSFIGPQGGIGSFDQDSAPGLDAGFFHYSQIFRSFRQGRSWSPLTKTMAGEHVFAVPDNGKVYSVLSIIGRGSTTAPVLSSGVQPTWTTVDGATVDEVGTNGTIRYQCAGPSGSTVEIGSQSDDKILSFVAADATTSNYTLRAHGPTADFYGLLAQGSVLKCAIGFSKLSAWCGLGFSYFPYGFVLGSAQVEFAQYPDPTSLLPDGGGNKGQQGTTVLKSNPTTFGRGLASSVAMWRFSGFGGAGGATNRGAVYLESETDALESRAHGRWTPTANGAVDVAGKYLQTTDATANQIIATYAVPNNVGDCVDYIVVAKLVGAAGVAVWKVNAIVENLAGTLTVKASTVTLVGAYDGLAALVAGSVSVAASGTAGAVDIRATGIAATTINWTSVRQGVEAA